MMPPASVVRRVRRRVMLKEARRRLVELAVLLWHSFLVVGALAVAGKLWGLLLRIPALGG